MATSSSLYEQPIRILASKGFPDSTNIQRKLLRDPGVTRFVEDSSFLLCSRNHDIPIVFTGVETASTVVYGWQLFQLINHPSLWCAQAVKGETAGSFFIRPLEPAFHGLLFGPPSVALDLFLVIIPFDDEVVSISFSKSFLLWL